MSEHTQVDEPREEPSEPAATYDVEAIQAKKG
jgi:hypothetical protein